MRTLLTLTAILTLGACATVDYTESVPALISEKSEDARPELSRVISEVLDGRKVSLSSDVLTKESRLIIEPKAEPMDPFGNPASGRLLGKPDHFVLKTVDSQCALYHEQTGEYHPLYGITCAPA